MISRSPSLNCDASCLLHCSRSGQQSEGRTFDQGTTAICVFFHLKSSRIESGAQHLHPFHSILDAQLVTRPSSPSHKCPSGEPWEAENHHHGDLNTDLPQGGPLWLECVEVRWNKMSERQGFFMFLFFASMLWGIVLRSRLLLSLQGLLERERVLDLLNWF